MGEAGSARRIRDCSFRPARCRGGETHRRRPGHSTVPASRARGGGAAQLRLGLERTPRSGVRITCTVNGRPRVAEDVWEGESLLSVLREHLDLPGSKNACEQGECGSCSVFLDGQLVCSCLVLGGQAQGREAVTGEGLAVAGAPDGVQEAFLEAAPVTFGFCTPVFFVSTPV